MARFVELRVYHRKAMDSEFGKLQRVDWCVTVIGRDSTRYEVPWSDGVLQAVYAFQDAFYRTMGRMECSRILGAELKSLFTLFKVMAQKTRKYYSCKVPSSRVVASLAVFPLLDGPEVKTMLHCEQDAKALLL